MICFGGPDMNASATPKVEAMNTVDLASYPGSTYIFFEFIAYVANAGSNGVVQLWDITASAQVFATNVVNAVPTLSSTDITAMWPGDGHMYEVRFWITAPGPTDAVYLASAQLVIQ